MVDTPLVSFTFKNTSGYFDTFCHICIKDPIRFKIFEENMSLPLQIDVNMSNATITFSYTQRRDDVDEEKVFQLLKNSCPPSMENEWKKLWDNL